MASRTQTDLLEKGDGRTLSENIAVELQKVLGEGANYGWKLHTISHSLVSQENISESDTHHALFNLVWDTPN